MGMDNSHNNYKKNQELNNNNVLITQNNSGNQTSPVLKKGYLPDKSSNNSKQNIESLPDKSSNNSKLNISKLIKEEELHDINNKQTNHNFYYVRDNLPDRSLNNSKHSNYNKDNQNSTINSNINTIKK